MIGIDIFTSVLQQGRRIGPVGSPMAIQTKLGWVLAGIAESNQKSCHILTLSGDDLLRKFWEIEKCESTNTVLSPEEKIMARHYQNNHCRDNDGTFIVSLPKKEGSAPLGESCSKAVRRFLLLERSLQSKNWKSGFHSVMEEYLDLQHAEVVLEADLQKSQDKLFYLPMHAVHKQSSTITKLRVVFDASASSSTGTSLNDILLVGPTVHSSLINVLLWFRLHRVALTTASARCTELITQTKISIVSFGRKNLTMP